MIKSSKISKKKTPALDQYINQLIEYFQPRMMLHQYRVEWKWVPKLGKVDVAADPDGATAEVEIDFVYYEMEIHLSQSRVGVHWRAFDFYKIAETIVHEMAHAYLEENQEWLLSTTKDKQLRKIYRHRNEQLTETLTRVILSQHHQDSWMPKTY